ncbi:MAG: hypothetical protein V2J07_00375 [Anaerolineae bacterium]|jgi:hypothetical protein|nr:hypothetical protein [Anaerolineae bacterium]
MCILCTAIPTAVVVGVAQNTKQKAEKDAALLEGLEPPKRIPAGPVTAVVVAGLLAGSLIYHATGQG